MDAGSQMRVLMQVLTSIHMQCDRLGWGLLSDTHVLVLDAVHKGLLSPDVPKDANYCVCCVSWWTISKTPQLEFRDRDAQPVWTHPTSRTSGTIIRSGAKPLQHSNVGLVCVHVSAPVGQMGCM
jgi:hypothetical protein